MSRQFEGITDFELLRLMAEVKLSKDQTDIDFYKAINQELKARQKARQEFTEKSKKLREDLDFKK
jgi:hypothetical protein